MSYGERIFTQTIERSAGATVRISLLERDYEGAATRTAAAAVPVIVTIGRKGSELWGQIQGTEIEYRPYAKTPGEYDFILGGDETKYKIRILITFEGATFGNIEAFVYTDLYEENDNVFPQHVSIRGGDGLGRLDQPYDVVGERRSMAKILDSCLKKTGVDWPIITFDELKPEGSVYAWDDNEIDDRIFLDENGDPATCKEVIQELLTAKGVNLVQGFTGGALRWIVYDRLQVLGTGIVARNYTDGVYVDDTTFAGGVSLSVSKALRGVTRRKERIPRVVQHIYEHGDIQTQIVRNGGFELADEGVPLNWTITAPVTPTATEFVEISGDNPLEGNNSLLMQSAVEAVQPKIVTDSRTVLDPLDGALRVGRYVLKFSYRQESPDTNPGTYALPPTVRFLIGDKIWNDDTNAWEADAAGKFTWRLGPTKAEQPDPSLRDYGNTAWNTITKELLNAGAEFGELRVEVFGVTPDEDEMTAGDRLQVYFDDFTVTAVSSPFFQSFVNAVSTRYRVSQGDTTLTYDTEGIIGDGPLGLTQRSISVDGAVAKEWGAGDEPLGIAVNKSKMAQVREGNSIITGTFTSPVSIWRPVIYKTETYLPKYVEITDIKQAFYTAEAEELREDIDTVQTEVRSLYE